jgi:hypothetical protein
MTFPWTVRLKYGALAGLAGWLAGWLITVPLELRFAWRYVDAHAGQLPVAVAKGMVVWGTFSLFMAMAGFLPLGLPLLLLVSPRWIVRRRHFLIPGVTLAALLAIYYRMGLLHAYHFLHPRDMLEFFISAPSLFVMSFALVMMWVYIQLSKRRLAASGVLPGPG